MGGRGGLELVIFFTEHLNENKIFVCCVFFLGGGGGGGGRGSRVNEYSLL